MSWRFQLVPTNTKINFVGIRYLAFAVSLVLVIGSFVLLGTKGLNFGVDFTGGTLIEIQTPEKPDLAKLRSGLSGLELGAMSIQEFGDPQNLLIRMPQQTGGPDAQVAAIDKVKALLAGEFKDGAVEYRRVEYVGPQVGEELKRAGLLAFALSIIGILIYIAARFEWQFGLVAVIALAHDAISTLGLFSLTGMEFDLSTMGAILLIAGYSINDTVVVFDRIRENLRKFKKMPMPELLNLSVNQMLSRSLMTSFTTLLALLALVLFGGEVIRGFTYALIFGIVVGTYSSVYVAGSLLLHFNLRRTKDESGAASAAAPAA